MTQNLSIISFIFNLFFYVGCEIPLLVRQYDKISYIAVNLISRNVTLRSTLATGLKGSFSLAVHLKSNTFIYNEETENYDRIKIASFFESAITELDTNNEADQTLREIRRRNDPGEEIITGVAVDWISDNIYVSVERARDLEIFGRIEVCPMRPKFAVRRNGSMDALNCGVALHRGLSSLHYLVVDPIDGYMYWLNRVHRRIERAWMNGEHLDVHPFHEEQSLSVAAGSDTPFTTGLTMDYVRREIFYVRTQSSSDSEIVRCKLYERMSCEAIVRGVKAFEVAVLDNLLMWTSPRGDLSEENNDQQQGIQGCALDICSSAKPFSIPRTGHFASVIPIGPGSQPSRINPNPCAVRNGDCSHICLLTPGAPWRGCACPLGVRLLADQRTCEPRGVVDALLVGSAKGLFYISLDTAERIVQTIITPEMDRPEEMASTTSMLNTVDVDYDPVERRVYWADRTTHGVYRCSIAGESVENVFVEDSPREISSLAVDWIGRNVLFADIANGRIELVKMEVTSASSPLRRTLISYNLSRPRALTVDFNAAKIYFVNAYGSETTVERISMDGSRREIFLIFPSQSWSAGIALGVSERRLYWVDGRRSQVFGTSLQDPTNHLSVGKGLKRPNMIAQRAESLFYNSVGSRFLMEIKMITADQRPKGRPVVSEKWDDATRDIEISGQTTSVKSVRLTMDDEETSRFGDSPCRRSSRDGDGCEHFCVETERFFHKCLCASGFELQSDDASCKRPFDFLLASSLTETDLTRISTTNFGRVASTVREFVYLPSLVDNSPPTAFAVDPFERTIYWSTSIDHPIRGKSGAVFRSAFDGGKWQIVIEESETLAHLCGIAVDSVITQNVFICNALLRRIEAYSMDGAVKRTLLWDRFHESFSPDHLVIHYNSTSLLYIDRSAEIYRLNYGRTTRGEAAPPRTLVQRAVGGQRILALSVDQSADRLIWSTRGVAGDDKTFLYSVSLNEEGGDTKVQLLVGRTSTLLVNSLTAFNERVYFANEPSSSVELLLADGRRYSTSVGNVSGLALGYSLDETLHRKRHFDVVEQCTALGDNREEALPSRCMCLPFLARNRNKTAKRLWDRGVGDGCVCVDHMRYDSALDRCRPAADYLILSLEGGQLVRLLMRRVTKAEASPSSVIFDDEPYQPLDVKQLGWPTFLAADRFSANGYIYWIDESADGRTTELRRAGTHSNSMLAESTAIGAMANCSRLFYFVLDERSRQLYVSCARHVYDHYGFVYAWRIKQNDDLHYIGMVVDGSGRSSLASTAVTAHSLPKEICTFASENALFYVDHSPSLAVSAIVRCGMDGRNCARLTSTHLHTVHPILLQASVSAPSDDGRRRHRIFYSTATGLWSREVSGKWGKRRKRTDPSIESARFFYNGRPHHHLTFDGDGGVDRIRVNHLIPIDAELMLVVAVNDSSARKWPVSEVYQLNIASSEADFTAGPPQSIARLQRFLWAADLTGRIFGGAAVWSVVDESQPLMNYFSCSDDNECSHICVGVFDVNDEEYNDAAFTATSNVHDDVKNEKNLLALKHESRRLCLCPLEFRNTMENVRQCERSVACRRWEFACHDGRRCVHAAARCDGVAHCPDESDELPSHCRPPFGSENIERNRTDIGVAQWTCDDGRSTIDKFLLCDGKMDCADASDELHCRCDAPLDYFDCTAWQWRTPSSLQQGPSSSLTSTIITSIHQQRFYHYEEEEGMCVLRAMLCDGRAHCAHGVDEKAELCDALHAAAAATMSASSLLGNRYFFLAAIGFTATLFLALPAYCVCFVFVRERGCRRKRRTAAVVGETGDLLDASMRVVDALPSRGGTPFVSTNFDSGSETAVSTASAARDKRLTDAIDRAERRLCGYRQPPTLPPSSAVFAALRNSYCSDNSGGGGCHCISYFSNDPTHQQLHHLFNSSSGERFLSAAESSALPSSVVVFEAPPHNTSAITASASSGSILLPPPNTTLYCGCVVASPCNNCSRPLWLDHGSNPSGAFVVCGRQQQQPMPLFSAPPPSTASLSIYGVVEPSTIKRVGAGYLHATASTSETSGSGARRSATRGSSFTRRRRSRTACRRRTAVGRGYRRPYSITTRNNVEDDSCPPPSYEEAAFSIRRQRRRTNGPNCSTPVCDSDVIEHDDQCTVSSVR